MEGEITVGTRDRYLDVDEIGILLEQGINPRDEKAVVLNRGDLKMVLAASVEKDQPNGSGIVLTYETGKKPIEVGRFSFSELDEMGLNHLRPALLEASPFLSKAYPLTAQTVQKYRDA